VNFFKGIEVEIVAEFEKAMMLIWENP